MNINKSPKEKLINRIQKEGIEYKESFNKSLINQYTYQWKVSYKDGCYDGGILILAPMYSDETILEQTYQLAHELGHHNVNKRLNPFILKIYQFNSILIKNIFERKAWKEAEKICIEESIQIDETFYLIKNKCLKTYSIINFARSICNFVVNAIISYYIILTCFYLIYKGINDNINDLLGVLKYFNGISIEAVESLSKTTWTSYIVLRSLKKLFDKYNNSI